MRYILDTNTLLLFIVGNASKRYIRDFDRTYNFSEDDFDLLLLLLADADEIFTIPQVIAETSNLLSKGFTGAKREHVWAEFRDFIQRTAEIYLTRLDGSQDIAFSRLGITDAVLAIVSGNDCIVLTCDVPLFLEITGRGQHAINFNYEIGRQVI